MGDYLLAVNGRELRAPTDPDSPLAGVEGGLTLSVAARSDRSRLEVRVSPLGGDPDLRQHNWVEATAGAWPLCSAGASATSPWPDFDAPGSESLVRGPWPLMDGAAVTIPKDSLASTGGRWLIEKEGVSTTIAADPSPDEAVTGRDRLLEVTAGAVLDQIRNHPGAPLRPPAPLPAYFPAGVVPGAKLGDVR